jgi:hypothetical protein
VQPSDRDTLAVERVLALWGHILDDRDWERLGECLTDDAVYDGSVFGFGSIVGLGAIRATLRDGEHARAHHATNIVVYEGPGDELRARSKGLGIMEGGTVVSATYTDVLRHTDDGWRISTRTIATAPS